MEVLNSSQSFNGSYCDYKSDDENNEHEKTFVTVHVDSFNEQDFTNFLNCLDTFRESTKKRKSRDKVIKNYCVQVPYIDNSIRLDDDDEVVDCSSYIDDADDDDKFERKCDEMKHNISQMFSYFDEDVQLNFDEIDDVKMPKALESRPVIRGVVRKRNVPPPLPPPPPPQAPAVNVLHKNQVDKLMNEFNRVKINYYSKDNYVEFTNVDYFYCDSDIESIRSEKVGRLNHHILEKFQAQDDIDGELRRKLDDIEVVPKNSVRDKISMFSKLDLFKVENNSNMMLRKCNSEPIKAVTEPIKENEKMQRNAMIRNTACANKNKNKCYIKDINNSLLMDDEEKNLPEYHRLLLARIIKDGKLVDNCTVTLMSLEHIVNQFGMSLLFTLNGLLSDKVFSLGGREMTHLALSTRPSLRKFNETFDSKNIDECSMLNVELSVVDINQIQLQMHMSFSSMVTGERKNMRLNVIFMAQYGNNPGDLMQTTTSEDTFFVYFTSFFEV